MSCNVPHVRQACCDIFSIGVTCQADPDQQTCMQTAMMSLPPAELMWMQGHSDMNAACPAIENLQTDPNAMQSDCTMSSSEPVDFSPITLAIMTAQQYQPPKTAPIVLDGCDSEESCVAHTTCSFDLGPMSCNVPHVRQACCDIFSIGVTCQADPDQQTCMQTAMMSLPPAELMWMQGHSDMNAACPAIENLQTDPNAMQSDCTMSSSEPVDFSPITLAIMTAQRHQPEKTGPIVPGVIGFAIGAAVVTSIVAMKKKRTGLDLYTPLAGETA